MLNFKDINFPITSQYSSDSEHIPLEFYENAIPKAKTIDMVLGYFSTNAIKTLCLGFSEFIYLGGTLRIVTNHQLTEEDKHNLLSEPGLKNENQIIDIFQDLRLLKDELGPFGQHFFDCLKFLLKKDRLVIMPVMHKPNAMAHYKKIILFDGENHLYVSGSANFTSAGIIKNGESFIVDQSWGSETEKNRISDEIKNFELIFNKQHSSFDYLEPEQIIGIVHHVGNDLTELELLAKTSELVGYFSSSSVKIKKIIDRRIIEFQNLIEEIETTPRFPYPTGPRPYQIEAYNNWKNNNYQGVFAMATGTGKTITSLNCVLNEYKVSKEYNVIILVPSIALLNQWEKETEQFNFSKVIKVGGGYKWESALGSIVSNKLWKKKENYIIIATYGSFVTDRFQKYFSKIQQQLILIADEAHNIGAASISKLLPYIQVAKKIGLSATPKRVYDPEGTDALNTFFKDTPPYCYEFGMEKALKEGFLVEYKYFPVIVELTEDETEKYIEISKQLLKFFDFDKGVFKKDPMVEILLLKRKNIIHKAANKLSIFKYVLKELHKQNKLRYVFTYVPEGYIYNEDAQGEKLLDQFLQVGAETISGIKMNSYTTDDDDLNAILRGFSEGKINMLFAMKMLDEGVDIPRAEVGIFCSSTGNPRQFIQRRGRLLRKHMDKAFATIYDMVVIPNQSSSEQQLFNMEKSLVKNELQRVAYFASLSMNFYDTKDSLNDVCTKYELNLNEIINEL